MQRDQTGSAMAEEVLLRQAMTVAYGSGHSLESPEKPSPIQKPAASSGTWQASVFWSAPRDGLCTTLARRLSLASWQNATLLASRDYRKGPDHGARTRAPSVAQRPSAQRVAILRHLYRPAKSPTGIQGNRRDALCRAAQWLESSCTAF